MLIRHTLLLSLLLCGAAGAQAGDGEESKFKVGLTAGTLGIGPEISYRISDYLGVRGNATFLSVSRSLDSDDITYDAKLKLQSGGAMLDIYPFQGGFRVSGGLRLNGNQASGVGKPNDGLNFEINGNEYTAAQIGTLRAETEIRNVAPSLTLGYGGGISKGFTFGVEAGILFQGSVEVGKLSTSGLCAGTAPPANCATLAGDLDAERRSVNEDIRKYNVWPILQLSIGYRF